MFFLFFFFKQKTAYEMRISDWSSDVCSSDLRTTVEDLKTGPKAPHSTTMTAAEEAMIVAFRRHTLLPLDDCLDRKSVVWGKSVSVRVDLGGRRIIKKKKRNNDEDSRKDNKERR